MAKTYPCQTLLAEYLRHGSVEQITGSYLDPPRAPVPRDRAGRLAYWTEAAADHVASWRLWSASDAYAHLYKALVQAGRSEEAGTALASGICLGCNSLLLSMCERAVHDPDDGGELFDALMREHRTSWICDLSRASRLSGLVSSIPADPGDRRRMAEAVPSEVLAVCLMAGPEECLAGASGDPGVKAAIYSRLFTRRDGVPRARCTDRPPWRRSSRRGRRWR